jgi:hypothetical protein
MVVASFVHIWKEILYLATPYLRSMIPSLLYMSLLSRARSYVKIMASLPTLDHGGSIPLPCPQLVPSRRQRLSVPCSTPDSILCVRDVSRYGRASVVVHRVGPLSNSWRMDWRITVEYQTISLVALIQLMISDSKSESTRHISRGSGCLLASNFFSRFYGVIM